jgi:hypothetical protein
LGCYLALNFAIDHLGLNPWKLWWEDVWSINHGA